MRRFLVLLGLGLALASPATAQPTRGSFGVDALVAPTTGLGFAYYVTDGLSLRPWLGLGYSDYGGFFAHVGAQLRFEPIPRATLSPYLSGMALYSHSGSVPQTVTRYPGSSGSEALAVAGDSGQFGAGAGLRYNVAKSVSLFGEGRLLHTTYSLGSIDRGWSSFTVNDRTRAEVVLGLTYLFR